MNEVSVFESNDFGSVRTINISGQPWFVAADVCKALDVGNPSQALSRLDDDERGNTLISNEGNRGNPNVAIINEPGLYTLVLGSRKPEAKAFKRWITHEVIPAIRQTGGYIAGESEMTDEELLSRALVMANEKIKHRDERIKLLESKAKEDAPRVLFAQAVEGSDDSVLIRDLAKILKQNGVDIGQDRLFALLRKEGYLISQKGESWNQPTQKSMNLGLMEIKKTTISTPNGTKVRGTPKITGKGQIYFVERYARRVV